MLQIILNTKLEPNVLGISAHKYIVKPACDPIYSIYSRGHRRKEDCKLKDSSDNLERTHVRIKSRKRAGNIGQL